MFCSCVTVHSWSVAICNMTKIVLICGSMYYSYWVKLHITWYW